MVKEKTSQEDLLLPLAGALRYRRRTSAPLGTSSATICAELGITVTTEEIG